MVEPTLSISSSLQMDESLIFKKNNTRFISINIHTNCTTGPPIPNDVIFVIDISESMRNKIIGSDGNNDGLTILDLVKYSAKNCINSLNENDRVSIITFGSFATNRLSLTNLSCEGKNNANEIIDSLQTNGSTNMWEGLIEGLNESNKNINYSRNSTIILLTDGAPSQEPPRGFIHALEKYKEEFGIKSTIYTFGFGYYLQSKLLYDISNFTNGLHFFIPDGSMIGSVFVNALSTIQSTCLNQCILKAEYQIKSSIQIKCLDCDNRQIECDWGTQIEIGSIIYGHTKSIVFMVSGETENDIFNPNFYIEYNNFNPILNSCNNSKLLYINYYQYYNSESNCLANQIQIFRCMVIHVIQLLLESYHSFGQIQSIHQFLAREIENSIRHYRTSDYLYLKGLINDLKGQIHEAVSNDEWWQKWGMHYFYSLKSAHLKQNCSNFKDPGIQFYASSEFNKYQRLSEEIFLNSPPPTPSLLNSYHSYTPSSINMSNYYNQSGGCFSGNAIAEVQNENGWTEYIKVKDLKPGMNVLSFGYLPNQKLWYKIKYITILHFNKDDNPINMISIQTHDCTDNQTLLITPWHPIGNIYAKPNALESKNSIDGNWIFPAILDNYYNGLNKNKSPPQHYKCYRKICSYKELPKVYNIVLEIGGTNINLNGIPVITLGHNLNTPVTSHPYYGTNLIIQDIEKKCLNHLPSYCKSNTDLKKMEILTPYS